MEFDIYNIDAQAGDKLTVKEVLMIVDDTGEIKVGQPYIEKASVDLKINGSKKGKKVNVMRFKAKSRYTKRRGFREDLTVVSVESINV